MKEKEFPFPKKRGRRKKEKKSHPFSALGVE